jgi:ABC-type multidrug transport system fused ATPase/permease subunit
MERDPARLAWTTTPGRHLAAGVLLLVSGLLLVLELEFVRQLADGIGRASGDDTVRFLRLTLPLPAPVGVSPLMLFPGIALRASDAVAAALAGALAVPIVIALLLALESWVESSVGAAALRRLRILTVKALLAAPPGTRDEVAEAALLAGEPLGRDSSVLGAAALGPARAGGTMVLLAAFVAATGWRLGLALVAMLILVAALSARRLALRTETMRSRRRDGASVEQSLGDLLRRMPALRAHGTADFERRRLEREIAAAHRPVEGRERRQGLVEALAAGSVLMVPVAVLATASWFANDAPIGIGSLLSAVMAAALSAHATRDLVQRRHQTDQLRPLLAELSRNAAGWQARESRLGRPGLPRSGTLEAKGVSVYDPASGARITGVDLALAFPAHVALVGDGDAGPRVLAALIGSQLEPSTGALSFGGVDLVAADPVERAHRIAFAGGDTVLIPGTLRDNLLYGCPTGEADLETRLANAVSIVGLDRLVHARGLAGTLDPRTEADLSVAIVESRRAVRAALAAEALDRFVEPFHADRYNDHATLGENILFGRPVGDTFQDGHLAAHPFMRAILEADGLTKPLTAMGLTIATSMIEIFAEIPDGHPLFERFSFFAAADRPYFEDLVERRAERRRRGSESARDRERLIGLALRYTESRHRLGLVDDGMRQRILVARADFAKMLPTSLQPAIEFYDPLRICTAASLQDNLLFGRIASDQAGAEVSVHGVIGRVLTERGLDREVSRIGLGSPIEARGADLTSSDIAAIDLVRCLVRQPEIVVVERALDGLPAKAAESLVARLRRALVGRGLVLVASDVTDAMQKDPFDAVIRFERGTPVVLDRRARLTELVPA